MKTYRLITMLITHNTLYVKLKKNLYSFIQTGINADCNLRGLTPICSCPRDMTGDPFVSCRPFTPRVYLYLCHI